MDNNRLIKAVYELASAVSDLTSVTLEQASQVIWHAVESVEDIAKPNEALMPKIYDRMGCD